jgi:restriction system protein
MSIWTYRDVSRRPDIVWSKSNCVFCRTDLKLLHDRSEDLSGVKMKGFQQERVLACPVCGWWKAERVREFDNFVHRFRDYMLDGAAASLRELDLSDVSAPIKEVRSYLSANYEKRGELHPKLFEETVADVFRDHGYRAEVTAYSGDGGIDVILSRNNEKVGVQVKRHKKAIKVEQIRSLAGALMLKDLTRGVFVTTSGFQSGGDQAVKDAKIRGYQIDLYDAEKFYDALQIAQRNMYGSFEEFPVKDVLNRLQRIEHDSRDYVDQPFSERFY